MFPAGSAANEALGKLMKPAVGVCPMVVTVGRRQEKVTVVIGELEVAVGVAVAVASLAGEVVALAGVPVLRGVTVLEGRRVVDVVPQAAVSATTSSGTSRR